MSDETNAALDTIEKYIINAENTAVLDQQRILSQATTIDAQRTQLDKDDLTIADLQAQLAALQPKDPWALVLEDKFVDLRNWNVDNAAFGITGGQHLGAVNLASNVLTGTAGLVLRAIKGTVTGGGFTEPWSSAGVNAAGKIRFGINSAFEVTCSLPNVQGFRPAPLWATRDDGGAPVLEIDGVEWMPSLNGNQTDIWTDYAGQTGHTNRHNPMTVSVGVDPLKLHTWRVEWVENPAYPGGTFTWYLDGVATRTVGPNYVDPTAIVKPRITLQVGSSASYGGAPLSDGPTTVNMIVQSFRLFKKV
jgi:beta-glucanase (GH16 family)